LSCSNSTIEENIDPERIIGSPKQILRSSDIILGRMYRDGKGVEKDLDKAAEWMRKMSNNNGR
jgi:TPR repeat protein